MYYIRKTNIKFLIILLLVTTTLSAFGQAKILNKKDPLKINKDMVVPAEVIEKKRNFLPKDSSKADINSLPNEKTIAKTYKEASIKASLAYHCNPVETGHEAAFTTLILEQGDNYLPVNTKAIWLPQDPENPNTTIIGIDSDEDCVRDDIEIYISRKFMRKEHKNIRKYLFEYAKWLGIFLKNSKWSVDTSREIFYEISKAAICVRKFNSNDINSDNVLDQLFSEFHNTFPRSFRYINNRAVLSGWAPREKVTVACH